MAVDFEGDGLLDGLAGEEREARLRLLSELSEQGVEPEELRRAVAEQRLALLPVERVLAGEGERYTAAEASERVGIELELLQRVWRALGLALADDDREAIYTDRDIEGAKRVKALLDAGIPEEGVLEVARLLGMTMSQLAAANRQLIADAFMREGDTEYDAASRFAAAAEAFMPLIAETLPYVLRLHLREQIRHDAFALADLSAGRLEAADDVAVCFADLVGFTQLGETLEPEALGAVTGRLAELAAGAVEPPVRLVKMIGDAVMLAGPDPAAVVDSALRLVETASEQGEEFPMLRAGVAWGRALPRAGDWYGRPVNLASRVTGIARPGSLLADGGIHDRLEDEYDWSFAGERRLKGIDGKVKLYRCRRPAGETGADD
ncbi:MAG TPA: adenylate cyclase regulatory domain-containing protein [Solirubrobacterales bacterium]|nr:adenylate cyclase regulatory domain-containing protein [Solirubrobacterales bacterium]